MTGAASRRPDKASAGSTTALLRAAARGGRHVVGYRLQLGGREIDAHACAFVPAAQDKLRKIRTLDSVPGPLGPGWTILEDRDIAVGTFPNDRHLKALRRLGESSARRVLLQQLLPSRPDLWSSEMQTLHYKPERRYVAGLTTAGATSAVVRVYSEDAYRSVRARMDVFRTASTLRVPRSLGSADRYQVRVVEWLPGRCLADLVPGAPELSAAAGLALGELHAQAPGGLPTLTKDAEIDALLELVPLLGFLHPRRSAWIEVLARRVVDRMAERPVFFPTHGDFYADQVLLGNGATVVLDLGEAVQTDPAADLGGGASEHQHGPVGSQHGQDEPGGPHHPLHGDLQEPAERPRIPDRDCNSAPRGAWAGSRPSAIVTGRFGGS